MRDAESMLDQLLSSSADRLTIEAVRDLLGLVDAEVIESFLGALVRGDALAGIGILDQLEESGRDLGAFLDQLVVALREALSAALAGASPDEPDRSVAQLTAVAQRVAAIDPSRQGIGGLRFQLELTLMGSAAGASPIPAIAAATAARPSVAPAVPPAPGEPRAFAAPPGRTEPEPAPEPAALSSPSGTEPEARPEEPEAASVEPEAAPEEPVAAPVEPARPRQPGRPKRPAPSSSAPRSEPPSRRRPRTRRPNLPRRRQPRLSPPRLSRQASRLQPRPRQLATGRPWTSSSRPGPLSSPS